MPDRDEYGRGVKNGQVEATLEAHGKRLERIEETQNNTYKLLLELRGSLENFKGRMAVYAALAALFGGGLVSLSVKLLTH